MPLPVSPLGSNSDRNSKPPVKRPGGLRAPKVVQQRPEPVEAEVEELEEDEGFYASTPSRLSSQDSRPTIRFDDDDDEDENAEYEDAEEDYEEQEVEEVPAQVQPVSHTPRLKAPATRQNTQFDDGPAPFSASIRDSIDLLMTILLDDESSEVILNGPNEVMFKKGGTRLHVPDIKFHDAETYHRVINEYILPHTDTDERIHDDAYLIEGQLEMEDPDEDDENALPLVARVHIVAPPVVRFAKVTIAKKSRSPLSLDDIASKGAMTREMAEVIKACARGRATIVFAGVSGAGKTTMLEATTHYFDQNDRIIVVEDTPELRLPIADTVPMTTTSRRPNEDKQAVVPMEWLVVQANRMRPDRIIVGEVRGAEMSEFLVAANSGADGSMTTVHASDPRRTLDKILGLAMKSEGSKSEMSVRREIASTIHIIVQITLIDGKHIVSHIEEISQTIRQESGAIATTPLFEYDRATGRHLSRNRPSEAFVNFLGQRGVELKNEWFM
jgi:Flp pilus assembly CpaF family ATPase